MRLFVLQLCHERVGKVGPDLAEGALTHISKGIVAPELVRVDLAVPAHTADPVSGRISLVHLQQLQDLFRPFRVFPLQPEIDIGAVRVIIHGQDLGRKPLVVKPLRFIHNQIHDLPGLLMGQVLFHQGAAAARINQVIETDPGDSFPFQKPENLRDILGVPAIHGEAQPNLDPLFHAVVDPSQCRVEGPHHAPEFIICLLHPVQADPHIGKPDLFQPFRDLFRDQGPVRGNHGPHAPIPGVFRQLEQILANRRLSAGKQNDRRSKIGQVIDQRLSFLRGQLVRIIDVLRLGIAVNTLEVAPPRHIPDHHRLFVFGKLKEMGREL